jgi:ankyrin repeat protein
VALDSFFKGVGDFVGNVFSARGSLLIAAQRGDSAAIQKLLDANPDILGATDPSGRTALHLAVLKGNQPVVELLLQRGLPVNTQDKEGRTALHAAAIKGNKEMALLLLANGADLSVKDKDNYTAPQLAYVNKHEELADALEGRA